MTDHADSRADQPPADSPLVAGASRRFIQRLLAIADNRLDLLMVEAEEERRHLLTALVLVSALMAAALMVDLTLSTLIVVGLWGIAPVWALACLCVAHGAAAVIFYRRLAGFQRNRAPFSATVDQLRKDRACLEQILS